MSRTHNCPRWCHSCPDLARDVMPGCMGTAAMGSADPKSLAWCTCDRPSRGGKTLEDRVAELEAKVTALGGVA